MKSAHALIQPRLYEGKPRVYAGGLTNPCGPGAENAWPVIVNIGRPPLPLKRAPTQKKVYRYK